MRIERHIFGSQDGYRTLAHSPDLTASECKALEAFAFGTPYEQTVRASFKANPAYWSRPLGGTRRAITRVSLGTQDDAGRPTLVFVTAVISDQDWNLRLQGDAWPLLNIAELWRWDRTAQLTPVESGPLAPTPWRLTGQSVQRALGLLSLVEPSWSFKQPVVVREDAYSLEEVMAVERLLPPAIRSGFSVLYRGIQGDTPVSLNCLARSVPADSARPCRRLVGPVSPYAKALARQGLVDGRLPADFVRTYSRFSQPDVETGSEWSEDDAMPNVRRDALPGQGMRAALGACLPVVILIVFAALISGGAIGWVVKPKPEPSPWPAFALKTLDIPLTPGREQVAAVEELQKAAGSLPLPKHGQGSSQSADQSHNEAADAVNALGRHAEQAKLADAADAALSAVTIENQESLDKAAQAVAAFGTDSDQAPNTFQKRLNQLRKLKGDFDRRASDQQGPTELVRRLEARIEIAKNQPVPLNPSQQAEARELIATLKTLEALDGAVPDVMKSRFLAHREALTRILNQGSTERSGDGDELRKAVEPIERCLKQHKDDKDALEVAKELTQSLSETGNQLAALPNPAVSKSVFSELAMWIEKLAGQLTAMRDANVQAQAEIQACDQAFTQLSKIIGSPQDAGQGRMELQTKRDELEKAWRTLKNTLDKGKGVKP
jgi:hypothetical protein